MLSDVPIIKMGQYIPLDPLTTLNGMMINYIIKRSCAMHLWTWDLKLKIKQQPTIIISCLQTSFSPAGKCAQGSPHGIIPAHIHIYKDSYAFFFVGPIAVYYTVATCLEKNLTSLAHVCDFITMSITMSIIMSIAFQHGEKGVFPATLAITSWKPPSAFLTLRSQRDLKGRRALRLWKGWEQSSPIERAQVKHNWCQRPADSITDEPGTHQRREISRHHNKKHGREKQSVLSQWKMAK